MGFSLDMTWKRQSDHTARASENESRSGRRGLPQRLCGSPLTVVRRESEQREHLREATGVALLGLRQRLEPLGDVVEALVARGLRHAGVHRLVLVGLAR